MLIRLLASEDDIEVVGESGTPQSSIMMLGSINPDVMLLESDISGGYGIARLIRDIKNLKPYIRIILCVGLSADQDIVKAAEYGASDIIRKPYNKTNLLRAVRNA
jgi:DNA-binding NarL/FixJ family response regulator